MSYARQCILTIVLCCSLLLTLSVMAEDQTPAVPHKLSLTAALVLTPEFCATGYKGWHVGKDACIELEPVLKGIFTNLTRVDDSSKAGGAQVVLEPKFADINITSGPTSFSNREMVVLVEWTVRVQSGKAVWIETVEGSARRKVRTNVKYLLKDTAHDMAEQSAAKMSSSPQLLTLSAQPVK